MKLSQEKFAKLFASLVNRSGRANISQYELQEVLPPLEFVFELAAQSGATLDYLFSIELEFEEGRVKQLHTLNMLLEPEGKHIHYESVEIERLRRLVESLSESLSSMAKLVNDVPALRAEVEGLKGKLAAMEKERGKA